MLTVKTLKIRLCTICGRINTARADKDWAEADRLTAEYARIAAIIEKMEAEAAKLN